MSELKEYTVRTRLSHGDNILVWQKTKVQARSGEEAIVMAIAGTTQMPSVVMGVRCEAWETDSPTYHMTVREDQAIYGCERWHGTPSEPA